MSEENFEQNPENWQKDNFPSQKYLLAEKAKMRTLWDDSEEDEVKTGLFCSWCKKEILTKNYYKCIYHKKLFCKGCALMKGNIPTREFPKCLPNKLNKKDCIWNKMEFK